MAIDSLIPKDTFWNVWYAKKYRMSSFKISAKPPSFQFTILCQLFRFQKNTNASISDQKCLLSVITSDLRCHQAFRTFGEGCRLWSEKTIMPKGTSLVESLFTELLGDLLLFDHQTWQGIHHHFVYSGAELGDPPHLLNRSWCILIDSWYSLEQGRKLLSRNIDQDSLFRSAPALWIPCTIRTRSTMFGQLSWTSTHRHSWSRSVWLPLTAIIQTRNHTEVIRIVLAFFYFGIRSSYFIVNHGASKRRNKATERETALRYWNHTEENGNLRSSYFSILAACLIWKICFRKRKMKLH